jgi:hypothetical protein
MPVDESILRGVDLAEVINYSFVTVANDILPLDFTPTLF